ncbi:MAG: NADH-quinone oxidoreductase subunit C, partial [bacterium]
GAWKRRRRAEIPVPALGPDLVDLRQSSDIRDALAKGEPQRLKPPKEAPALRPAATLIEIAALEDASAGKSVGVKLAERFGANRVSAHAKNALVIDRGAWLEAARALKDEHGFDYLANVSSADYADAYEVVYHLYNTSKPG